MHEQILLLVDDDPLYIDLVREILSTKNFTVIAASNGAAALALLQKHRVTMIISDIDMPEWMVWRFTPSYSVRTISKVHRSFS